MKKLISFLSAVCVASALSGALAHALPPLFAQPKGRLSSLRAVVVRSSRDEVEPAEPPTDDVVTAIVTIDGTRWTEIHEGVDGARARGRWRGRTREELLPNFVDLIGRDGALLGTASESSISASGPDFMSLPGYSELFSGTRQHGCADNECGRTKVATVFDELVGRGKSVAVFGSWPKLENAVSMHPQSFPISVGRTVAHGLDEALTDSAFAEAVAKGKNAYAFPGDGGYRPDRHTIEIALRYFELYRPDLFYLGLGDTDEYAHRGDYDRYLGSLHMADQAIGRLRDIARGSGRRLRLFVTSDHGRAEDFRSHGASAPESARVFLLASGPSIRARGAVPARQEASLADLAPTLAWLLLGEEASPGDGHGRILDELL